MPSQAGYSGQGQIPDSHNPQFPPQQGQNAGWQYGGPNTDMEKQRSVHSSALVPTSRNTHQEVVESRSRQTSEQYQYQQYGQSQAAQVPAPQVEELAVPVMLCHTCSHCGQMRSAGYHRNNPVVPGKPLVPAPCRRCKKKLKSSYRSSSKYTRIRKCSADEPCDWPRKPVYTDADCGERRGRQRSREEVYLTRYSPSRPRIVRRESSHGHMGLGVLQQPEQELRTERVIRTSSLSPRPSSRYAGKVWPSPDIVRTRVTRSDEVYSAVPEPLPRPTPRSDEVWPPPDVVRTHSYRKVERSPRRRESSRIIELSPSPPPRARSTRVVYRSASQEQLQRRLSVSPAPVSYREERRSEDAETRLKSHPQAYRPVIPDPRTLSRTSDETCSNTESMSRNRLQSPSRSILKSAGTDRDTSYRRRDSMRDSQQSMHVEARGPRVHFGSGRKEEESVPDRMGRSRYVDDGLVSGNNHYRDYSRQQSVDRAPPILPTRNFEKLRIRDSPPSQQRDYEDEIRIDRQRRISASPPPRQFEQIRVRHTSPTPLRRTPRTPPSPDRTPRPLYRHISRPRAMERARSLTPPLLPHLHLKEEEDHTDSDSAHSAEITEVRSWRGIDEHGKPATFVEERKTVRMIDQGSDRGGLAREYRDMGRGQRMSGGGERMAARSWRDI